MELEVERKQAERKHEPISSKLFCIAPKKHMTVMHCLAEKRKLEADNSQCSVEGPSYSYISLDQNQNNEPLEIVFDDTLSTSYGRYIAVCSFTVTAYKQVLTVIFLVIK